MHAPELPFVVKVCGITNEEDARLAIEAGANALGFNFWPKSKRYVTPERARQISDAVRGEYLRVGVFVNPREEELLAALKHLPLDVIQLHGDRQPARLPDSCRIWKSVDPNKNPQHDERFEAYLLDTPSDGFGGSGVTFAWDLASEFPYRAIIAGGLDAANVGEAIALASPWGVDACSRLESSPGKKDRRRVEEFVRAALAAAECLPGRVS